MVPHSKAVTIDASSTCTLECDKCRRQTYRKHNHPPGGKAGGDMTLENFDKLLDHFDHFSFCGQVSDPIFNPHLIEMLQRIHDYPKPKGVHIATAATSKKHDKDWYRRAFEANPNTKWTFGIDGLPEESCMYRINQDGEFLFEMAKMCAKICRMSVWQYIVFSYNENHIEEAMEMASSNGIVFELNISARWDWGHDMFKPKNPMLWKGRPDEWKKMKPHS
jgi:MoaA/NifB/PqqE/SkfB family radical SAM enzyme